MAISTANFVREVSSTGGTGTYSLGGASGRYQTFIDAVGTGSKVYYHAFDDQDFESGIGTITDGSPDTLSRDTILESSNADAAVDWPASGQRTIVMTAPASKTVLEDENGDVTTSRDVYAGRDLYVDGGVNYDATDTGSADAYAIQLASTLTAYRDGLLVMFKAANANTGASTLDVNSIGAKSLKRRNGDALESGDIAADDRVIAYYDSDADEFRSINVAGTASSLNTSSIIQNGGTTLPAILSDTKANRPAASTTGRWFYATDERRVYRDLGAGWEVIGGRLERALYSKFEAGSNVDQSVSQATETDISFESENYNEGGITDNVDNTIFTLPRSGVIRIAYSLSIATPTGGSDDGQLDVYAYVNGSNSFAGAPNHFVPDLKSNASYLFGRSGAPLEVNQGWEVKLAVFYADSGSNDLTVLESDMTWFAIEYVA